MRFDPIGTQRKYACAKKHKLSSGTSDHKRKRHIVSLPSVICMDCIIDLKCCQAAHPYSRAITHPFMQAIRESPAQLFYEHKKPPLPRRLFLGDILFDQRQARGGNGLTHAAAGFVGDVELHLFRELGIFGLENFLGLGKQNLSAGTGGDAAHD